MSYLSAVQNKLRRLGHRQQLEFHANEISELREEVRKLREAKPAQTAESFDAQWRDIPTGNYLVGDAVFDQNAIKTVEAYTDLPASWFKGKAVLDAGCGNGRWSLTLCRMGAKVTAIDISESGLASTTQFCAGFPDFTAQRHNLLNALPFNEGFDMVWNYGVCHHTGNTGLALRNAAAAVKPDGVLFTMIYGEPGNAVEFEEINTYTRLRREVRGMDSQQKIALLRTRFPEERLNGWFDAVSPEINDLHRFDEIRGWLTSCGFSGIRRTIEGRNHHVVARRS